MADPSTETGRFISAWEHPDGEESAQTKSPIRPHWPGGGSGLTIGMGYDLKHHTAAELRRDWGGVLSEEQLKRLEAYAVRVNKKGKRVAPKKRAGKAAIKATRDIVVDYDSAVKVFEEKIQPRWEGRAYKIFPGLETMDPYTQASVVSMVYNRGDSMKGKKGQMRGEHFMEIKKAVAERDTKKIAATIRAMKVDHNNPGNKRGLHRRREAEAKNIEDNQVAVDAWYGKGPAAGLGAWP
jgi:hypothetical protein